MLYNRCTGIYKFGNNTYPQRIRHSSNLGHIFQGKKVRLMGREIGTSLFNLNCIVETSDEQVAEMQREEKLNLSSTKSWNTLERPQS
jgi:hypothetical protein